MNMKLLQRTGLLFAVLGISVFLSACSTPTQTTNADPKAEAVAVALTKAGVTMYGAWWCPHCKDQKAMFGDAFKDVHYVECATPDGKAQTQVCIDAKISSYPTWQLKDGTRKEGVQSLDDLISWAHLNIATTGSPGPVAPST